MRLGLLLYCTEEKNWVSECLTDMKSEWRKSHSILNVSWEQACCKSVLPMHQQLLNDWAVIFISIHQQWPFPLHFQRLYPFVDLFLWEWISKSGSSASLKIDIVSFFDWNDPLSLWKKKHKNIRHICAIENRWIPLLIKSVHEP